MWIQHEIVAITAAVWPLVFVGNELNMTLNHCWNLQPVVPFKITQPTAGKKTKGIQDANDEIDGHFCVSVPRAENLRQQRNQKEEK